MISNLRRIPGLNPTDVRDIAYNLLYRSQIYFDFTDALFKLEVSAIKEIASQFLRQVEAIRLGKKPKNIKSFILARPGQVKDFPLQQALRNLKKTLDESLSLLRSDIQAHSLQIERSLLHRIDIGIDKTNLERKKALALKQLKNSLNKQVKNYTKALTLNNIMEGGNKADLLGANITDSLIKRKMVKKWVSRLDSKVRPLHDQVNFQTRRLVDFF